MGNPGLTVESVPCDLCGARRTETLFVGADFRYGVPGQFPVVRCLECSLVFTNPRPVLADLPACYPKEYGPHVVQPDEYQSRIGRAGRLRLVGSRGLTGTVLTYLYNSVAYRPLIAAAGERGTILDVGCGTGGYLSEWKALGWVVEGVEPDPEAVRRARQSLGPVVHVGMLAHAPLERSEYDLLTMIHVLEHSPSPCATLEKAASLLGPRGRLILAVPNFGSLERRVFRQHWYALDVPRHLYHFTPRTLARVLDRAGLEIDMMGGNSQPSVPLRSLRKWLGSPRPNHGSKLVQGAGHLAMLPLAALRRSTNLWAIASRKPQA